MIAMNISRSGLLPSSWFYLLLHILHDIQYICSSVANSVALTVAVFTAYVMATVLSKDSVLDAEPTPEHHRMDQFLSCNESSYFKGYCQATPLTLLMPRIKNATPGTRRHARQVGNIYVAWMNSLVACSISTQTGIKDNIMEMISESSSRNWWIFSILLKTDTYALLRTQDFNINLERKSYRYIHCHYETIHTEPDEP